MTTRTSTHHTDIARIAQPPRWASWVAVSSAPQAAEDKISIPHQRQLNQEHCSKHGGEIIAELLVPGESRHIATWEEACQEVTAYALLRDLIVRKQIDVLVFYDRTRLGRMASLIMTIEALCLKAGIALYETTNPPAEIRADYQYERSLVGAIGAVGAQQEIEKLKERRRIGMINRIKNGEFAGRLNWGYYYRYDERGNRTVEVNSEIADVVRQIFGMYLKGRSLNSIAWQMTAQGHLTPSGKSVWTYEMIVTIVESMAIYAGYAEAFRKSRRGTPIVTAKGKWEPIISEEILRAARQEHADRAANKNTTRRPYRFSGMTWCIECGGRMKGQTARDANYEKFYTYMRCLNHSPMYALREEVLFSEVEKQIITIRAGEWGELDIDNGGKEDATQRLADIERRRKQLSASYEIADNAYVNQRMDEARYNAQIALLDNRKAALDDEYRLAMGAYAEEMLVGERAERLKEIRDYGLEILYSPNIAESNAWLRRTFRIWCRNKEVVHIEPLF